jgi:hypothetical protein
MVMPPLAASRRIGVRNLILLPSAVPKASAGPGRRTEWQHGYNRACAKDNQDSAVRQYPVRENNGNSERESLAMPLTWKNGGTGHIRASDAALRDAIVAFHVTLVIAVLSQQRGPLRALPHERIVVNIVNH